MPVEYYDQPQPSREEIDAMTGPVLVEFGAAWCGYCQAAEPEITRMLGQYPAVRHIKIEDGKGRSLGRSFRVKLWPTLVFMQDGRVLHQVSRPTHAEMETGFRAFSA